MKFLKFWIFLAILTSTAHAADGRPYFTWFFGQYLYGLDQQIFDSHDRWTKEWNVGLRIAMPITEVLDLEATFSFAPTRNSVSDTNIYNYHFNGNLVLPFHTDELKPYITMGIGAIRFSPEIGNADTDFAVNYGAGVSWNFAPNFSLRPDVRALSSFTPTHTAMLTSLNLTYTWEASKASP